MSTLKYNIIGNGCFSTFCTRDYLKHEYVNPFIWSLIKFSDMLKLIQIYDNIDWHNMHLVYNKNSNNYTAIINDIHINYIHYRYKADAKIYTVIGNDGFFYDMENFLYTQWFKHIDRMKNLSPIFAIANSNSINLYSNEECKILEKASTKYPIIIIQQQMGNSAAAKILFEQLKNKKLIH